MRQRLLVSFLVASGITASAAHAAQVMFPAFAAGAVGQSVVLAVEVSQLDVPPGLGGFHFTIDFGAGGLRWTSDGVYATNALGPGGQTVSSGDQGEGHLDLTIVSLLSPDELYAIQRPDMVLLFVPLTILDPTGLIPPNQLLYRPVSITGELTEALGNPIDTVFVVPEPGTAGAAAVGLALVAAAAARRRRHG